MSTEPISRESVRRSLLAGLVLLCAMLALQWFVGARRGDHGVHSDDAAHFLASLLVRDYVTEALGQNPVAFARDFYVSYPKDFPGMWPPLFHVTLGLFFLPPWPPLSAALFLLAAMAAWTAWRLYGLVSLFSTRLIGMAAGLLFLSTPVVVSLTTSVMVDIALAALAIEAVYWLAVFTRTGRLRHAALFGLVTALGCLTKGNGISLLLVPIAIVFLTGRFDMLRRPGLYASAGIIAMLALPAVFVTYLLDEAVGNIEPITVQTSLTRVAFYSGYLWTQFGPVAMTLAIIGFLSAIIRGRQWHQDAPIPAAQALAALAAGTLIFHLFSPHIPMSGRYLTLAIAPLYGLTAVGVQALSRRLAGAARRPAAQDALLALLVVATFFARPTLTVRKPFGYGDAVTRLEQSESIAGKRLLVVSDDDGEGALVADVATREVHPRPVVVRASRLLGRRGLAERSLSTPDPSVRSVIDELEKMHINYLFFDSSREAADLPHWTLLKDAIESDPDRVQIEYRNTVDKRNGPTRPLSVYRLTYRPAPMAEGTRSQPQPPVPGDPASTHGHPMRAVRPTVESVR